MCGFTGYLLLNQKFEVRNNTLKEMLTLQKHRGPDDSGILGINVNSGFYEELDWKQDQLFDKEVNLLFGFNRLSILDLTSNGHQPMMSFNKQVVIMMNGEIYNAFDFKSELISKGYHFKGSSDTEIVLNLYLAYGLEKMLELLNGMFAIAIYDFSKQKLFLIRDRMGIKPLYILQEAGRIAFSSEIKSFKALSDFHFEPDLNNLDEFLLFRNLINRTLFKNIINIEPGSYLEIDARGNYTNKTYYHINQEGDNLKTGIEAFNSLESALAKSVNRQLISDVKLGCQLSGGVDSSLVTWYANKRLDSGQLESVSIVFDVPGFSEKTYIDKVSDQLNLLSHQFLMEANYYLDVIDKASWHFEQPLNHPNTIGIYLLSQEARKHVTVLLSGEGADECLSGYSRFIIERNGIHFGKNFLGKLKANKSSILDFLGYWGNADKRMIMSSAFASIDGAKTVLPNFSLNKALDFRMELMAGLKTQKEGRQRKYEVLTYLPDLLMRQDKMSMAHSIENRVPFLDNEMIHSAFNMSDSNLIMKKNGKIEGKAILKDICANHFGQDFAYRSKMGFGIPLRTFMNTAKFRERWQEEILPGIKKRGIFETKALQNWGNSIEKASSQDLEMLWLMTGFEIWAKQYL